MADSIHRPSGYKMNPQAMAAVSARKKYTGHPALGSQVCRDTWITPRYVLSQLGEFDLDPCAAESNPHWVCATSYTIEDDGLSQPWHGRVFMNPPFSNTVPWLTRHTEHGKGISLVPASVESRVWRKYVWIRAKAIFMTHGRMRFSNPDGSATTGRPLRPVALIGWSEKDADILRKCSLAGVLLEKWEVK